MVWGIRNPFCSMSTEGGLLCLVLYGSEPKTKICEICTRQTFRSFLSVHLIYLHHEH